MVLLIGHALAFADEQDLAPPAARRIDFADDVYPLLRERCFACHQGANSESGVRLDHHAKLLGETDGVPLVVVGASARSRLVQAVAGTSRDRQMPPSDAGPRLTDEQIGLLRAWIDQGAKWDDGLLPDPNRTSAAEHWAFKPVVRPAVPKPASSPPADGQGDPQDSATNPIDAFVVARHRELQLTAAKPAAKRVLIRRLYLVLHGLPPTIEQVERFLDDRSAGAWERLVERVLKSPHYGERVARHWLDSARWAESEGFAQNNERPFAWRYRDYVTDSFNRDKPYSEFLRQQIAGDELQPYSDENLIATGFLAAARISADDLHFYRAENDMYTDMVSALSRSVLGLTIGCAQCHDHKFDPVSQRDFYRLQAFFRRGFPGNLVLANSPRPKELDGVARDLLALDLQVRQRVLNDGFDEQTAGLRELLHTAEPDRTLEQERIYRPARISLNIRVAGCNEFRITPGEKKRLDAVKKQLDQLVGDASQTWGFYSPATSPHTLTTLPMAGNFPLLHDQKRLAQRRSYLLARGRIFDPVAVVTPGWPAAFGPSESPYLRSRPRTALADWITSTENPLTARVWVNRIWQMHFGRGLVDTPGNFGVRGSPPSHPRLLDWLASELMQHAWSTRHIHRLIVTSQTWRQSSRMRSAGLPERAPASSSSIDPDNRFLWRWPRRRLEAEAIRDSMLVASGELDRSVGGRSVPGADEGGSRRRGLYLFQKRDAPPVLQALFDGPTAMSEACVQRHVSTSALQALYLLNNDFARRQGRAFARRIKSQAGGDIERQIDAAFERTVVRLPTEAERRDVKSFLSKQADLATPTRRESANAAPRGLSLWLRADSGVESASGPAKGTEAVTAWVDQRLGAKQNQSANRLVQATVHRRPGFVANPSEGIGGLPVVRFAGGSFGKADHFLTTEDGDELRVEKGYTLFAVVRFNGRGQGNETIFLKARNGGNDIAALGLVRMAADGKINVGQNIDGEWKDRLQSSLPVPDQLPVLIVVRWNGQKLELDVYDRDGHRSSDAVDLPGKIAPGVGGRLSIGGYADAFSDNGERLNGDLGEILYYRQALSDHQRVETADYLRQRWLTLSARDRALEVLSLAMLNLNEFLYIE